MTNFTLSCSYQMSSIRSAIFHDKQFRYNNVNTKVINVSLFVLSMLFLEDKYKYLRHLNIP